MRDDLIDHCFDEVSVKPNRCKTRFHSVPQRYLRITNDSPLISHHFLTLRVILIAAEILLASPLIHAQTTTAARENAPVNQVMHQRRVGEPATLVFWNRDITVFRSYFDQLTPAERATGAADRLSRLPEVASEWKITVNEVSNGAYSGLDHGQRPDRLRNSDG
jgi:hypothetical protein